MSCVLTAGLSSTKKHGLLYVDFIAAISCPIIIGEKQSISRKNFSLELKLFDKKVETINRFNDAAQKFGSNKILNFYHLSSRDCPRIRIVKA
jgi:hypothetical protein